MINVINFEKNIDIVGKCNYKILKDIIKLKCIVGNNLDINIYSIEVELTNNEIKDKVNISRVHNITFSLNQAIEILRFLFDNEVLPEHLEDIIQDKFL